MADNIVTLQGHCVATDEIAGCHHLRTKLTFGVDGSFVDVSSSNPLPITVPGTIPVSGTFWQATQPVSISGTVPVSGPLTDAQLRASPLGVSGAFYQATQPVSGTFWQATQPVSISAAVTVSGPLTDIQLRATAVPVSGTFFQATQPVSIATMPTTAVTGTFWQATQPVSGTIAATQSGAWTATAPALTKGTQPVTGYGVQQLRDSGRVIVNAATAIAGITAVTTEALLALNVSRDGAATGSVTTIAVTSGKRLRILGVVAGVISTAAAVISARVSLRINPSGAASPSSPILVTIPLSQQSAALAQAGDEMPIMFPEAIEISGTMQVGLSQVASVTTGTVWASLIAYEY